MFYSRPDNINIVIVIVYSIPPRYCHPDIYFVLIQHHRFPAESLVPMVPQISEKNQYLLVNPVDNLSDTRHHGKHWIHAIHDLVQYDSL